MLGGYHLLRISASYSRLTFKKNTYIILCILGCKHQLRYLMLKTDEFEVKNICLFLRLWIEEEHIKPTVYLGTQLSLFPTL